MGRIFVQADSSQAEARVIALLGDDEITLQMYDTNDIHALTASWFFGGVEKDYSKKVLGYEHPIRFVGKTLRHAGHLGAGKRRASNEVNTSARKYHIPIMIDESIAERALTIFHAKSPRVREVFQASVIECLRNTRRLVAPLPYGVKSKRGGTRTFFERWGDELFRQGFSYLPQRAVSDNTKGAALRIREQNRYIRIVLESHDSLLFDMDESELDELVPLVKYEMERPIRFDTCSIPRHDLIIPCEIETGYNYKDLKKFKLFPIIRPEPILPKMPPKSITEQFLATELPKDSFLDNAIYREEMKNENF